MDRRPTVFIFGEKLLINAQMKEYVIADKSKCLECGTKMTYGRSDKKFCCEKCKNKYNNREKINLRSCKTKVDRSIQRNYDILRSLLKAGVAELPLSELLAMDFNPSFVTSFTRCGRHTVLSCYDISFIISDTRIFNIHRISVNSHSHNLL